MCTLKSGSMDTKQILYIHTSSIKISFKFVFQDTLDKLPNLRGYKSQAVAYISANFCIQLSICFVLDAMFFLLWLIAQFVCIGAIFKCGTPKNGISTKYQATGECISSPKYPSVHCLILYSHINIHNYVVHCCKQCDLQTWLEH